MKTDHTIAGFELRHARANFYHGAGQLMAKYLWRRYETVVNFLDVRAADSAGGHAEEQLALANFGDRHGFDHYLALATIHSRAHVAVLGFVRPGSFDVCDGLAHLRFQVAAAYGAATPALRSSV